MKILLVCSGGDSSSLVAKKMQNEARKQEIDITVKAKSIFQAKEELSKWDIILISPQIQNEFKRMKLLCGENQFIDMIPPILYGRVDGKAILKLAIDLSKKKK